MKKGLKEKIAKFIESVGIEKATIMCQFVFINHPESIIDEDESGRSVLVKEHKNWPVDLKIAQLYYCAMVMEYLYGDEEQVYFELKKIIDDNSRNA